MQSKTDRKNIEGVWKLTMYGIKEESDKCWSRIIEPKKQDKLLLIVENLYLKVLNGNVLEENLSLLWHDIKGIKYDKDSMGVVTVYQGIKKKFLRFRFSGTMLFSGADMCKQCAQILSHYVVCVPVDKENQTGDKPDKIGVPHFVSQFLKNSNEFKTKNIEDLESIASIEEVIDDCILDVNFPDFVLKIHKYLDSKLNLKEK